MASETPKSLGELNYEKFAHRYAEIAQTKPHNAYYERPATRSLVPDVAGKRILDAGCGPGFNTQWLLDQGAAVVAFDVTPDFVTITRGRVGDRAAVYRADLTQPRAGLFVPAGAQITVPAEYPKFIPIGKLSTFHQSGRAVVR